MTREQIKSQRKLQKLSQAELGRLTNLTASEISRIECGYRNLTDEESAAIASVLQSKQPPPPPPPRGMVAAKTAGATATAAVTTAPTAVVVEAPSPVPAQPAVVVEAAPPKPLPAGNDLSDPANFGVLPELALLNPGTLDREAFRARLSTTIARATTILHTPRVPAAVWRAWRQFEQQATALLRETVAEAPALAPVPLPIPLPKKAPPVQAPAPEEAAEKGESKSYNSLFVEAARSVLPPPLVEHFNQAAEAARTADASIGFMKHFRQIAERELEPALLKRVTDEAGTRAASPERSRVRRGRGR